MKLDKKGEFPRRKEKTMRKMKKTIIMILVCLFLPGLICACGSKEETKKINIGYFNNVTHAQALFMKSEQMLEKVVGDETKVNWVAFNAGPAEVEALFAENIDIGYIGPVPAISANTKSKGDVVVLTGAAKGGAVMVKHKEADINTVKDLDGKTVAIPQIGNTQHLCLLHLLEENGLKPVTEGGTVTVTAVANADVANMMERGDIDAALVPEPWGATLQGQGAELLLDYDEVYAKGEYDVAVVVVRKEFMEQNPELVEAFLAAHEEATVKITENQEEALAIINAELQNATGKALGDAILTQAFERISVNTDLHKESVMGFAQISKEQGFISEEAKEADLFVK